MDLDRRRSYPIDVTGQTAFDLDADVATSIAIRADGDPGSVWYRRGGGKRGSVQVGNQVKGRAYLALTVNSAGILGNRTKEARAPDRRRRGPFLEKRASPTRTRRFPASRGIPPTGDLS